MTLIYYSSVVKTNSAAWLVGDGVRPLEVRPAPCPSPEWGGPVLIVKVRAVAINHSDVAAQATGMLFQRHVKYPRILGCDLAGEVVQVGWKGVAGIRVGDRVLGLALGGITATSEPSEKAFQEYALVRVCLACVIPDKITYEQACVFPLTMTIASNALFHEDYLELCPPTVPPREPDASSDVVIITAGGSSVGCHAIQLACSAGYWVYSTTSPEHFDTLRKLGAMRLFDYHKRNVADDILSAVREENRTITGAVAIGIDSLETCRKVLSKYKGGNGFRDNNKFIAFIEVPTVVRPPLSPLSMASCIASKALWKKFNTIRSRVAGVQIKLIAVENLCDCENPITRMMFRDFLPRTLDSGHVLPAPQPKVVGKGLEKIQQAFDVLRDGVSAEKVVVSM
ncbi:hypothetical protein diail_12112 [Diaporthe ilicicola]|nr:hypothetical protein diail_12112 [Diaporthe ilicicola]